MKAEQYKEIRGLSQKISGELVFAEAGKEGGLLPVNCLLMQMEEILGADGSARELFSSLQPARACMDGMLETTGQFTAETLKRLRTWAEWWTRAVELHENNLPIPAMPSGVPGARAVSADEPLPPLNLAADDEMLAEFVNEGLEHLAVIEQGLLALEKNPRDAATLDSIFRAFHTFKGSSGFLNLTAIQTVAHELESLLDRARQGGIAITPAVINIILEGGDVLKRCTSEIAAQISGRKPRGEIPVPAPGLLQRIHAVLEGGETAETSARREAPAVAAPSANHPKAPGAAVKVDISKLDALVDMVGEMIIAQSLVAQSPELAAFQSDQFQRDLARLGCISKDIQRTALSLRMVPVRATFQKMNRLVRDIAAKVGKEADLVTTGEETELDRTIVEELGDPLAHMIRNALDHGIEKPAVRLERGKPERGTITLSAFHQGGNIVVEIKDDGGGLDRDKILARAVEKGIVKEGQSLAEDEIFALVMAAGFSTAETVTDISGRGVGMDVVRRNIEKLRGKIELHSRPGEGSTFRIYLPLTLAIIDGLLVCVGEQRYIIPTPSVCESFRPAPEMICTLGGRGEMIRVRGRMRPLLRLGEEFGIRSCATDPAQGIVVVVESGSAVRCVLVDQLLGRQEVVIKTLGDAFPGNHFVSGAAILGDGRVGLILDPQALACADPAPAMEVAA